MHPTLQNWDEVRAYHGAEGRSKTLKRGLFGVHTTTGNMRCSAKHNQSQEDIEVSKMFDKVYILAEAKTKTE